MQWAYYLMAALAAYLVGSIPTGYLVGRAKGIDIRSVGSGNIGATNVFRAVGKKAGSFVLAVDIVKGYVACQWMPWFVSWAFELVLRTDVTRPDWLYLVVGLAAILGHNYTCWLGFKGGKGIATTAGVFLALATAALLVTFGAWAVVFLASGYVSLASLAAAVCLPIAVWFFDGSPALIIITAAVSILAIYKHRTNLQRLINGTEHKVSIKKAFQQNKSTQ